MFQFTFSNDSKIQDFAQSKQSSAEQEKGKRITGRYGRRECWTARPVALLTREKTDSPSLSLTRRLTRVSLNQCWCSSARSAGARTKASSRTARQRPSKALHSTLNVGCCSPQGPPPPSGLQPRCHQKPDIYLLRWGFWILDWLIQLKNHGRPRDILVPKYEGDGWLVPCRSPHPGSFGSNGVCIFYLYLFLKVSNVSITSIDGRATRI